MLCLRRVGRVLVRKLLLRGYAVTVLVRSLEGHNLPQSVSMVQGDVKGLQQLPQSLRGHRQGMPASHAA